MTSTTIATLKQLFADSQSLWEMAVDTAEEDRREEWQDLADHAADAWHDALSEARAGEWGTSLSSLESARSLAREGGDDGPERKAIEVVCQAQRAAHASDLASTIAAESGTTDSGILAIAEGVVEEHGLAATLEQLREAIAEAEEEYAAETAED